MIAFLLLIIIIILLAQWFPGVLGFIGWVIIIGFLSLIVLLLIGSVR